MNCPHCNKEMEIMWVEDIQPKHSGDSIHQEVVGRCWDCDFDARWKRERDAAGNVKEYNLQRFFFG